MTPEAAARFFHCPGRGDELLELVEARTSSAIAADDIGKVRAVISLIERNGHAIEPPEQVAPEPPEHAPPPQVVVEQNLGFVYFCLLAIAGGLVYLILR